MLQHISVLTLDKMLISSLAMPLEMLEAAISFRTIQQRKRPDIEVAVLSTGDVCRPVGGLNLQPGEAFGSVARTDLIMIPALWRNPLHHKSLSPDLLAWLCARIDEGARVMAIGTGVWLLGQAGLLDGNDATTHWHALDDFEADFPAVRLQRDHLLTQSGRIYCAASINSGADLMIHLIGTFFDAATARFVEQQFSPEARMSYDKRVFTEGAPQHADETMALVQSWMHQHWTESLNMTKLAEIAGISSRQLVRRFSKAIGQTPALYLQNLKCRQAQEWLQNSDLAIADIAQLCGFSDSSHFGRVFRRWKGVSPGEFRKHVRSKLFSADIASG